MSRSMFAQEWFVVGWIFVALAAACGGGSSHPHGGSPAAVSTGSGSGSESAPGGGSGSGSNANNGCQPTTCAARGANCGSISDGCTGMLACGTCTAPETCGGAGMANVCGMPCTASTYTFPAGPSYASNGGTATLSRTTTWAPGIAGGIPAVTAVCKTLSPTGHADDNAINSAIAGCTANHVVRLNPGTYQITNPIQITSNVVLRGSGGPGAGPSVQTRLIATSSVAGPIVNIGPDLFPGPGGGSANCTADAVQGTTSVTVSKTTGFHVGDLVLIDIVVDPADDTGSWVLNAPSGGTGLAYPYAEYNPMNSPKGDVSRTWFARNNRPISQVMEIQAITGSTLTFSSPFHMTFDVAHAAQVTPFTYGGNSSTPTTNAGLEDLYVAGPASPGNNSAQNNNVVLTLAKYSWVKNVESDLSNGYSIGLDSTFRCVVRDSYMHSTVDPSPGGGGYGLEFSAGSADNLIENNISWNFNKVMVMRAGGGGNVMGYNYMDDGWINYQPNWMESGMNADHMASSHFELFEGNLTFALDGDDTWGSSVFVTWLRNVATGHRAAWPPLNTYTYPMGCTSSGPNDDKCMAYTDVSPRHFAGTQFGNDFYNFVGNVLGYVGMPVAPEAAGFAYASTGPDWPSDPVPIWMLGYDDNASGTDQGAVNTIFRDGNFDYATNAAHWSAAAQPIPSSLYVCSKPAFFGSYTWPWADGSNATTPYSTHAFQYYALSPSLGTFATTGALATFSGYALPAFVRFLQLHGVEAPAASCSSIAAASAPAACALLLTGVAP